MENLLDGVRFVAENSDHVKVDAKRVASFCNGLHRLDSRTWLDNRLFDMSALNETDRLNFTLLLDSQAFCYWGSPKWTIEYGGKPYDGSWGMIVSIRRALESGIPILSPLFWENMKKGDLRGVLKGSVEIPLFTERLGIIRELGSVLNRRFGGDFAGLIGGEKDVLGFLDRVVAGFPSFNDASSYKGREIAFFKRAQLLAWDLHNVFMDSHGAFGNIDMLTGWADYKLPYVLRKLGILKYSEQLGRKVDHGVEIPRDSAEEVEIRANTLWAISLITEELKGKVPDVNSAQVSCHLWYLSQDRPPHERYHLTRTVSY
ncbi:MAG: hypothetical protein HY518_05755 [Candidatus Aenigmarchaeota archaeon]|nr:hypothetical protein [Candidatus Aenigmarchaeota archaeon]